MTLLQRVPFKALIFVLLAGGCRVQDNLDGQPWPCDITSTVDQCGTKDGRPMLCWEGFCSPSCDSGKPVKDGFQCLTSGVLVQNCHPSQDDCAAGLHCLRTDLQSDDGLCTPAGVCSDDQDCAGTERSTCASTILHDLSPKIGTLLHADHLQCFQEGCSTSASACLPQESCLAKQYDITEALPDVCVPKCDANQECPPNFACAQSSAEPGPERLCLPGVPGVRCVSDEDCLLGTCVDTHSGFSVCTLSCSTDSFCALFNTSAAYYLCLASAPGEDKHCLTARPFQGPDCDLAKAGADCPPGQQCFNYDPYGQFPYQDHGECRTPCAADLSCPALGGLPHVCLAEGAGGCYPGNFGMVCASSDECLRPMACLRVDPKQTESICTISCTTDQDCSSAPETNAGGYCAQGFCRLKAQTGAACARNAECSSGRCMNLPDGRCID